MKGDLMDSFASLAIMVLLVVINAFFVAAEFALVSVPRAFVEREVARGDNRARLILQILRDPVLQDQYIATAQIGITLASLGLGMWGEHTLAQWINNTLERLNAPSWLAAHTIASMVAVGTLTFFHILLGEMVPKSLALQYAKPTAFWIVVPMRWTNVVFYPVVLVLNAVGNAILSLMSIQRHLPSSYYLTAEELGFLIKESEKEGFLQKDAGRILRELLEFGDLTAGEVMVPRVKMVGIPLGARADEIRDIVRTSRHSRYPVFQGDLDHILGVVHIKDLLRLVTGKGTLGSASLRPVPYVPETSKLDAVLAAMRRRRTHLAIVMDEFGGTAGLVTIEDLFAEVVGHIGHDSNARPEAYFDTKGRLHAAGTMRLDELGEHLGFPLEHTDVCTVSGLILALLERQPRVGDFVQYRDLRFEVTAVSGHGVEECLVSRLNPR